jgi:2-methylcitrate dehydratase PrpD
VEGSDGLHVDGVATKPYSCCRKIHAAIDGALQLMQDHRIPLESIRSIVLRSPTWRTSPAFAVHAPADMAAAQFSAPYCVAAALHGVTPGPGWFDSRTLTDPAILETSSKVVVEPVESPDGQLLWISVKLVADRTHHLEIARPLGEPSNPMSGAALESKFHHLVSPVLGEEVAAQLHETLRDLTALSDLSPLALLLRKQDA